MLLFIPFIALITLLPGGDPHRDFSWWWLMGLVLAPLAVLAVIAWRTNFFNQVKEMFASKRRPKTCESCGESTDRTHFLDGTWRNKYEGNQTYLCLGCLRNELAEHYATLRNRCVVAEPVAQPKTLGSPSNAYYAYTNSDEDIDLASVATDGEFYGHHNRAGLTGLHFARGESLRRVGTAHRILYRGRGPASRASRRCWAARPGSSWRP